MPFLASLIITDPGNDVYSAMVARLINFSSRPQGVHSSIQRQRVESSMAKKLNLPLLRVFSKTLQWSVVSNFSLSLHIPDLPAMATLADVVCQVIHLAISLARNVVSARGPRLIH